MTNCSVQMLFQCTIVHCLDYRHSLFTVKLRKNTCVYFILSIITHAWHTKSEMNIKHEYESSFVIHCIQHCWCPFLTCQVTCLVTTWSHTNVTDETVYHTYKTHLELYVEIHQDWNVSLKNLSVVLLCYFTDNFLFVQLIISFRIILKPSSSPIMFYWWVL
jgi:hypothetical protein